MPDTFFIIVILVMCFLRETLDMPIKCTQHEQQRHKKKKKMGRLEVLKEILETERVYCNHLKKLEEVYDKPLLNSGLLDSQLHTKIFKDLNVIRSLNENLL